MFQFQPAVQILVAHLSRAWFRVVLSHGKPVVWPMEQVDGHKFPRSTKLKGGAVDEDAPRTAELEDALRLNLEQLQKWLAEQETCLPQALQLQRP
eukprot:s2_g31.t1